MPSTVVAHVRITPVRALVATVAILRGAKDIAKWQPHGVAHRNYTESFATADGRLVDFDGWVETNSELGLIDDSIETLVVLDLKKN